jgi:hypothetical protein
VTLSQSAAAPVEYAVAFIVAVVIECALNPTEISRSSTMAVATEQGWCFQPHS